MTKKDVIAPSKKIKKKIKIIIPLMLIGGGILFFINTLSQEQRDQSHLLSLQTDIQSLRTHVRQLESILDETKKPSLLSTTTYTKEDLTKIILWQQVSTEVWSGQPFRDSLEKLLDISAIELKTISHIQFLLDQGTEGIPTIERLWLMVDEPQENTKPIALEEGYSFWLNPLKYIQSQFKWQKFFIIKTQANEATRRKLKKLIAQRKFEKALSFLKESKSSYVPLENMLHRMIEMHFALKIVEERIILSLTSGGIHEK